MREKKREPEGEIVWRRKNQEDKKEIVTHRYERQRSNKVTSTHLLEYKKKKNDFEKGRSRLLQVFKVTL